VRGARIGAVIRRREEVVGQEFVEHFGDFGGLALHHLVALRLEVAPELREHFLPFQPAAGNVVELVLHFRGEIIGDVAGKETFEEGRQQAAGIFREEAVLFHPHIGPVAQGLDGGGIGGGPPDA